MEKRFYTSVEVADLLRIKPKTLRCYHSRHELYRPARSGVWHKGHVAILEKVWAGALSEDEGVAFWKLEKRRMWCECESVKVDKKVDVIARKIPKKSRRNQ